jgi:hypothetical protein
MNIFVDIGLSWAALDVLLLVAWHVAHVRLRAPRTGPLQTLPRQTLPAPVETHATTAPARRTLVNAA